jgi:formamidopyrimidine-DNA glycosylase
VFLEAGENRPEDALLAAQVPVGREHFVVLLLDQRVVVGAGNYSMKIYKCLVSFKGYLHKMASRDVARRLDWF